MANPTSNFNWQMPTSSDLVTDLPADFEVFGQAVDTSLADLKGGTTGQVLAKASNADMDFVWTADASGIPASAFTAKGNILVGTGSGTYAAQAVGTNGQVLAANSAQADGVEWVTPVSGSMTELATGNLAGSAQVRLQSIPGTYKALVLYVRNQRYTNTNATWGMRLMNDSTANRYASQSSGQSTSETFRYDQVYATSDLSNTAGDGMSLFTITDYTNTTTWKMFKMMSIGNNKTTSTAIQLGEVLGAYNQTGAVTEVDICSVLSGGNFTAGTYTLYGVN